VEVDAKDVGCLRDGAVRIGATLTDSTGTLSPVDVFVETALSSASAARNQWNRLSCTLNIQDGYDTAKFWILCTSATAAGGVFMVDSVCVRETSQPQSIIDKLNEAFIGAAPTSPQPSGTLVDRIRETFAKIVDGLRGHAVGTTATALPSDVHAAATELKATADVAVENAGVATELAQSAADPNLVTNPRFASDLTPLYSGVTITDPDPDMYYSTDHVSTAGGRSVKTVGERSVYPLIKTYGNPWDPPLWMPGYVSCSPGDVFYVEAKIFNPSGNASVPGGYAGLAALQDGYASPTPVLDDSFGPFPGLRVTQLDDLAVDAWTTLWGYFTVPAGWYNVGFRLDSYPAIPGSVLPNVYYWADPVVMRAEAKVALDAAAAAQSDADAAASAAASAATTAGTASTTAAAASTNVQSVVDGVSQSVFDNGVTGYPVPTVKARLQKAWASIYDGLNGTTGTPAKVPNDVAIAAAGVKSSAATAETSAAAAHTKVDSTTTALFGSSTPGSSILTAAVPNLPAAKITSGTIDNARLATKLTTVGSGFVMRNTTDSINLSCSANTATAIKFTTAFYDSAATSTSDYTTSTGGSGEFKVSAANAGWYMAEVAFGIDQTNRIVGYRLAAALFLNGSLHKIGSTVDYFGSSSGQHPFCAQGAFIVFLNAGDYITPGCMLYSQSTISGLPLIAPNMNQDTYFSVSLLNRSLA
jgi:hypothetical protein